MLCRTLGPQGSCLNEAAMAIKVAALLFVAQTLHRRKPSLLGLPLPIQLPLGLTGSTSAAISW